MKNLPKFSKKTSSSSRAGLSIAALFVSTFFLGIPGAMANHPVLVEGETDFDGDGLLGLAEDTDGTDDRIFGTINAALAAAAGGANQNGRVTIVTSGRFAETLVITGASGNVTVEGAPGVEANIDAVIAGTRSAQFPGGTNATRQAAPGIVVNSPSNRTVTLRNLVSRNWTEGIQVIGSSRVLIDNVRVENNVNYGIRVEDSAKVTITNSQISATGFRAGAVGNSPTVNPPSPGIGVEFDDTSTGAVGFTTIVSSFAGGLVNSTGTPLRVRQLVLFDNAPDRIGVVLGLQPPF